MANISTAPFDGQKPGTSGLRKTVQTFVQPHYLENYIQAIFDSVPTLHGALLIIGGDGRYYNDTAIQTILRRENYPKPYEALKALTRGNDGINQAVLTTFVDGLDVSESVKAELRVLRPELYTGNASSF